MKRVDKIKYLRSKVKRLEKIYNETNNADDRDKLIRAKRELNSIDYSSCNLRDNNIYSVPHTIYYRDTGTGLRGQK